MSQVQMHADTRKRHKYTHANRETGTVDGEKDRYTHKHTQNCTFQYFD